jgi:hypothetical protein
MATPEAALVSLLVTGAGNPVAALIGTRAYPLVLPQNPAVPAIRYQRISTTRGPYRALGTGRAEYAKPRFQLDCYATTAAGAKALADAVRIALDGFAGTVAGISIGSMALEDEDADLEEGVGVAGAPLYRSRLDFLMGHVE